MGGDQKLSDAEFAQLLFELERSSINDEDFARRLAHLQEYGNLGHFPIPQPVQPRPIPVPQPIQPVQPIQIKPQIPPQFSFQPWGNDSYNQSISRPPVGFQPAVPAPILPPIHQSNNIPNPFSWSDSSLIRSMAPEHKYCQICRISLDNQWVHISNCPTEHTFCVTCAERLCTDAGNNRWNVNQIITCPLCKNTKSLGNAGIDKFICSKQDNHAGRVSYEDGTCPYHKDILLYLCLDCIEPMCMKCQSGYHKNHSYETLDTALADKKKQLKQLKSTLRDHRNEIVKTTEKLAAHKEQIITNAQNRRDQIAIQFANLRDELNRKERELIQQVNNLETRKNEQLELAVAQATSELDSYDSALRIADQGSSLPASNPMQFIQFVCDKKEEIMTIVDLEDAKNNSYSYKNASHNSIPVFPALPATQNIQNSITRLQLL